MICRTCLLENKIRKILSIRCLLNSPGEWQRLKQSLLLLVYQWLPVVNTNPETGKFTHLRLNKLTHTIYLKGRIRILGLSGYVI